MKCPFRLDNENQVKKFEEEDPYNGNIVKGYINRRQGRLYGSMWITHVNGEKCKQLIVSAPKQHYPFDKKDNWKFPEFDKVEPYEKIDGTCIISYNYKDADGNSYLAFKTRLTAFLRKSKYGNFYNLWDEMLKRYPQIKEICDNDDYNYIFELYGKRNKILIEYPVSLDTKCIFAIRCKDGAVIPPSRFNEEGNKLPKLPKLLQRKENVINKDKYKQLQDRLEDSLIVEDDKLKGIEGCVLYYIKDGKAVQIKCKPPTVLKHHWSGGAIPYQSAFTTVYNAFENYDKPTYEDIVELLKEEYEEDKIEKSSHRIKKALEKATFEKKLQKNVVEDYEVMDMNIKEEKGNVMRWFAEHYPKSQAKRIFRLLNKYEEEKDG